MKKNYFNFVLFLLVSSPIVHCGDLNELSLFDGRLIQDVENKIIDEFASEKNCKNIQNFNLVSKAFYNKTWENLTPQFLVTRYLWYGIKHRDEKFNISDLSKHIEDNCLLQNATKERIRGFFGRKRNAIVFKYCLPGEAIFEEIKNNFIQETGSMIFQDVVINYNQYLSGDNLIIETDFAFDESNIESVIKFLNSFDVEKKIRFSLKNLKMSEVANYFDKNIQRLLEDKNLLREQIKSFDFVYGNQNEDLLSCCCVKNKFIVANLLETGINANLRNKNSLDILNNLNIPFFSKNNIMIKYFMPYTNLKKKEKYTNKTALHWVCENADKIGIEDILKKKIVDINAQDSNGNTALHTTILNRSGDKFFVVTMLLKYGLDKTIRNNKNQTGADIADMLKKVKLLNFLKESEQINNI